MQNSFSNLFHLNNHPPRSNHIPIPNHGHGRMGHLGHHRHHYFHHYVAESISMESCPETPINDIIEQPLFSSSPRVEFAAYPKEDTSSSPRNHLHRNNHHHHSIQELIRHFGKKMQNWRSEGGGRRNSCSESGAGDSGDHFRSRSKSLDCNMKKPLYRDCEETYRIYDTILKEGTFCIIFDLLISQFCIFYYFQEVFLRYMVKAIRKL